MNKPCNQTTTLRCGVGGWLCPDCTSTKPPSAEKWERAVELLRESVALIEVLNETSLLFDPHPAENRWRREVSPIADNLSEKTEQFLSEQEPK